MIPLQLTIKNFLSYQTAKLDFRGLHTACICGVNGSGKSSLLEAIAWVLWGRVVPILMMKSSTMVQMKYR
ncbi:MAG: AAA family ATPase [Cyanobacteria bacterium LVE1205-1]